MTETTDVRVRFAPSPTGTLHIGSARTALFNYLFARRHGGKFVLRIEDTDQVRSTVDSLRNIVEGLMWLDIRWDEGPAYSLPSEDGEFESTGPYGPYFQHERRENHRAYAKKLLNAGLAYLCDCPPMEEVAKSKCRCFLRQDEIGDPTKASAKFRVPKGVTVAHDLISGDVEFDNESISDFLIVRPNGFATYNFAAACDDIDMKISHVIRGMDHLSNTPRQIMIYNALGEPLPKFGHIPLIHGDDGVRLSKRHGAVSVRWYREEGFLPEAFVNYLAALGWSDNTDEEFHTMAQLERKFDLAGVAKSPAKFDLDKLIWFNGKYIRQLDSDALYAACEPYLIEAGLIPPRGISPGKKKWLKSTLWLYSERIRYFKEVPEKVEFFFNDPREYLLKDLKKAKVDKDALLILKEYLASLKASRDFNAKGLEELTNAFCEKRGISLGRLVHPLRLALTGKPVSPGIFETLEALGKKRVVRRLSKFVKRVEPVE